MKIKMIIWTRNMKYVLDDEQSSKYVVANNNTWNSFTTDCIKNKELIPMLGITSLIQNQYKIEGYVLIKIQCMKLLYKTKLSKNGS